MSFSSGVKEELYRHISPARHCQLAELAALLHFNGSIGRRYDGDFSADSCGKCARCEKMLYIITENI